MRPPRVLLVLSLFGVMTVAAGCENPSGPGPIAEPAFKKVAAANSAEAHLLKAVHKATARFHSQKQAEKAGYLDTEHCVAVPGLGGMGVHWVNPGLVDPEFDPTKPEAILYEPHRNGKGKLVGVEYIVIDVGQPAPTFAGQPFDVGGVPDLGSTPHWSLHVWLWKHNPSGMFMPFNPDVVCP